MAFIWIISIVFFACASLCIIGYILRIIERIRDPFYTRSIDYVEISVGNGIRHFNNMLHSIKLKITSKTLLLEMDVPPFGHPITVVPYHEISEVKYGDRIAPDGRTINSILTITKPNGHYLKARFNGKNGLSFADRVKNRAGLDKIIIEDVISR